MSRYRVIAPLQPDPDWQRRVAAVEGVRIVGFGRALTVALAPGALSALREALGPDYRIEGPI